MREGQGRPRKRTQVKHGLNKGFNGEIKKQKTKTKSRQLKTRN